MLNQETVNLIERAGKVFQDYANKEAAIKRHGRMCDDCAFKKGSEANSELETLWRVENCLIHESGEFNCHTKYKQDAGKPCIGFLHAKEYLSALKT